jgi:hypothetical protein
MSLNREEMNRALTGTVVPALRTRGFTGSFPHFRRLSPSKTDLLTFQFANAGGAFLIELAEGPADELISPSGVHIPARKLKTWDLNPIQRVRVRSGEDGPLDLWYHFDRHATATAIVDRVVQDLAPVEEWFAGAKTHPRIYGYPPGTECAGDGRR